jgi:hypothetical protein
VDENGSSCVDSLNLQFSGVLIYTSSDVFDVSEGSLIF